LLLIALVLCRLCVHEHPVLAERGQHTCGDVQGSEVSLGRFFQDQLVQREVGNSSLESCILQFEFLELPRLVDRKTTVLVSSTVIGLLGYRYLSYCSCNCLTSGQRNFNFSEFP
jgi:hypothetical protein